jgi:signal transduction histidine kinase
MSRWLSGKRAGALAFLVIAALVIGGLGWVTRAALKLEEEQAHASAAADRAAKMRLALWRLDSRLFSDLVTEAGRPFSSYTYSKRDPLIELGADEAKSAGTRFILELVSLNGGDAAPWLGRHFLLAPESKWRADISFSWFVGRLGVVGSTPAGVKRTLSEVPLIAELVQGGALRKLLNRVELESAPAANERFGLASPRTNSAQPPAQQGLDPDTTLRLNQAQAARARPPFGNNSPTEVGKKQGEIRVAAVLRPLIPEWTGSGKEHQLVVGRLLDLGDATAYELAIVDWDRLQSYLTNEVGDLLPKASFLPIVNGATPSPERAMAAIPVELELPSALPVIGGWTPLRAGLSLAWAAALVALAAVGLGGWSLLEIAERRSRFVSAVTHELRTPLTTLRLYLDMLAGGMVRDEQRAEYLATLNVEADRLNRLVGNVLDFSRLENQRPRLEVAAVKLADVLGQVRLDWGERCRLANKELVIDDQTGDGFTFMTDVQVVKQILGNLIDNACKYSRDAADPRIWVRAHQKDGELLVDVEDKGPGVSAGDARAIFRPFRRGRRDDIATSGVGLGLALSRRWAELLGGRLLLVSESGGACFRLVVGTLRVP